MFMLGPVGFITPWLLGLLALLPLLWFLLRAVPPVPVRRLFPGIVLLLGLEDKDAEADRTPWWLLLLRLLAVAAMIVGFAGPVLNPASGDAAGKADLPLLVFVDNSWAAASDWQARLQAAENALDVATQQGRLAAVALSSVASAPRFQAANVAAARLAGLAPVPWDTPFEVAMGWAADLAKTETIWISDGLARDGRAALLAAFEAVGPLRVLEPPAARLALRPSTYEDGQIGLTALRSHMGEAESIIVLGQGPDPAGIKRNLAQITLDFEAGAGMATAQLSLPPELRNRIARFQIAGENAAGATSLADDSLHRRRVGLVGSGTVSGGGAGGGHEGLELLQPLHFLRNALALTAELIGGEIQELTRAGADVIILADIASLPEPDQRALAEWVADGGLLLRFAGPALAAADIGRGVEDILLPVRLRAGGRVVGGAMSWGAPRAIAPFAADSPFYGLHIPEEVKVKAQVLAEPGPELSARIIASLADGTPLVTRKALGAGQVVLFHITANAEWSSLPLSGLFVEMLERLAVSTPAGRLGAQALEGTSWQAVELLDGFGILSPASGVPLVVPGTALAEPASAALPPGLYGDEARRIAVNVTGPETVLAAAQWPARVVPEWGGSSPARDLSGWLWLLALAALGADIIATLALSGRLPHLGRRMAVLVLGFGLGLGRLRLHRLCFGLWLVF